MGVPLESRIVVRRTDLPTAVPRDSHVVHGVRHAGESVQIAAQRALDEVGLGTSEPWVVDLSGQIALMAVDVPDDVSTDHLDQAARSDEAVAKAVAVPDVRIAFRPMTRADFPDVVRWTTTEHVARWWSDEAADVEGAERHYGPALDGHDPTRMWVVEINGRSVGFVQDYLIGDHPDWALLTARPDDVGFDYAIGEPAWAGRGTGTRMLWQFLRDLVAPHYPLARHHLAAPDHRNAASLRVLDKLGFERGLWFDEPQSDGGVNTLVGCTLDVKNLFGRPADGGTSVVGRLPTGEAR